MRFLRWMTMAVTVVALGVTSAGCGVPIPADPADDVDTVNDAETGNAPNVGTGEPSASG